MNPDYYRDFGLTRDPFNVTPDPSFLYLSPSHREAMAQLGYGIRARRGFVLLTGEVGTGKTTLIHALLEELNGSAHTAFVYHTIMSPKDLLRYVCEDFGILPDGQVGEGLPLDPSRASGPTLSRAERVDKLGTVRNLEPHDYLILLNRFLLESYRRGENVALIIDEAQNLSIEVLECIRLLSNFETTQDKLLQILLVGQPELRDKLSLPELRAIRERLGVNRVLVPLNGDQTRGYIALRLHRAGGDLSLISPNGLQAIYRCSGGIPRLINILGANGLLKAHARGKRFLDAAAVREAASELHLKVPPEEKTIMALDDRGGRREPKRAKEGPAKPASLPVQGPKTSDSLIAALAAAAVVALVLVVVAVVLDGSGLMDHLYKAAPPAVVRSAIRGGPVAARGAGAEPVARAPKPLPARPAAGAGAGYTINPGDSLSRLAERFYGSQHQWKKIYEANLNTVKNPDRILAGQKIIIPGPRRG